MNDAEKLLESLAVQLSDGQRHSLRIFGHGASGKSTFAQNLCQLLDSSQYNLLETDPYIIAIGDSQVVPKDFLGQKVTACMPVRHELASLERDVRALQAGMNILTIDKIWHPSRILSGQKPVLIVEGMSAAFLPKELFDLSICFYTDDETELQRRLERDTAHRNRKAVWIEQTHQARRQQYERYYRPYQEAADIVIRQSGNQFIIESSLWR